VPSLAGRQHARPPTSSPSRQRAASLLRSLLHRARQPRIHFADDEVFRTGGVPSRPPETARGKTGRISSKVSGGRVADCGNCDRGRRLACLLGVGGVRLRLEPPRPTCRSADKAQQSAARDFRVVRHDAEPTCTRSGGFDPASVERSRGGTYTTCRRCTVCTTEGARDLAKLTRGLVSCGAFREREQPTCTNARRTQQREALDRLAKREKAAPAAGPPPHQCRERRGRGSFQ
jgi:hypothetical protein